MKKRITFLIGLIVLACGKGEGEPMTENTDRPDPIVGRWEEVLDQSSPYDRVIWTFSSTGDLQLDFDETRLLGGRWSAVTNSTAENYSLNFQQYPDATKRVFFLQCDFSANATLLHINGASTINHWVSNRNLVKIEE